MLVRKKLVIASHNEGKVAEFRLLLAPLGMTVINATEAGVDEPEETGQSFAANAELKALHSAKTSGLPSLADDSGLVIPALKGAPGVYSARWAGPDKNFSTAFQRIEQELREQGLEPNGIAAYFNCTLALAMRPGVCQIFEGIIHGMLTFPPQGEKGFGYDPIFIPQGYTQSFAQIAPEIKNRISHRAKAFEAFMASGVL